VAEVSAQSAPLAPAIAFYQAETYDDFGADPTAEPPVPAGLAPYGLAIADVVSPFPPYLPDGLPDVAVACAGTVGQGWPCDDNYACYGRVVIFVNTGDWAADGQSNGLEHFANIDFPVWSPEAPQHSQRPPFDLRWADMDRDPPQYDLDLVVTTGRNEALDVLPASAVWIIRNNCNSEQSGRFELLFDERTAWQYPMDYEGSHQPQLDVEELTGDTYADVAVGGVAAPGHPLAGETATHVYENIGGLQLYEDETTWALGTSMTSFGSAVVARRTREDPSVPPTVPPNQMRYLGGADIYMSVFPTGDGADALFYLHPTLPPPPEECPVPLHFDMHRRNDAVWRGYGLALQEFRPCELALVSTYHNGLEAWARVAYLDGNGDPVLTSVADYELVYLQNPPVNAWGVASGRFDTTDKLWDFVVAYGSGGPTNHGGIAVFRNDPLNPGQFYLARYFDTNPGGGFPTGATFVAVADMDLDGRDDVVVSNTDVNNIAVLINSN
jgi:hypothetical protein